MKTRKTKASAAPRWIGASAPRHGTPGKPRTIRATDETWLRWSLAAGAEGKSVSQWLHSLAAEALKTSNPSNPSN